MSQPLAAPRAAAPNLLAESGLPRVFAVDGASRLAPAPPSGSQAGEIIRLYVRSLSVMQKEALAVSSSSPRAWRLVSDEGAYLDGFDEAPPPLAFLSTGMVASYMNEVLALGAQHGVALRGLRLTLDNYYTMKGSALRGTMVGGAEDPTLTAEFESEAERAALAELMLNATVAAPVNGLVSRPRGGSFTLSHNGREIAPGRAARLDAPALAPPSDAFAALTPAPGDWEGHLRRGGLTPRTAETDSRQGSSLAESQDRRLHVSVVCALREDGVKVIEQSLHNPQGTMFALLSDESVENGGGGRAPDAASYVSAGIGFCFMTQLGRYAKIAKRDLKSYGIIQDIAFSPGGASGRTGQAGDAGAPATHLHVESAEDADFARALLDMGEQTCFLHALCRASLKTRIRLR